MTILAYIITIVVLYCIVLYSIKRDWPPCRVVFRVGNQNTKCDKYFVCLKKTTRLQVCTEHHQ